MAVESPSPGPALKLSDDAIDELSWPEIARAGWRIARMRIVIFPVIVSLIAMNDKQI